MHMTTTCHQHSSATNSSYLASNQNMHSLNSFNTDLTRSNTTTTTTSGGAMTNSTGTGASQRWTTRQGQHQRSLSWHGGDHNDYCCECKGPKNRNNCFNACTTTIKSREAKLGSNNLLVGNQKSLSSCCFNDDVGNRNNSNGSQFSNGRSYVKTWL